MCSNNITQMISHRLTAFSRHCPCHSQDCPTSCWWCRHSSTPSIELSSQLSATVASHIVDLPWNASKLYLLVEYVCWRWDITWLETGAFSLSRLCGVARCSSWWNIFAESFFMAVRTYRTFDGFRVDWKGISELKMAGRDLLIFGAVYRMWKRWEKSTGL